MSNPLYLSGTVLVIKLFLGQSGGFERSGAHMQSINSKPELRNVVTNVLSKLETEPTKRYLGEEVVL